MALQDRKELSLSSPLIPLHPFLDSKNVLHVGSREYYSRRLFSNQHPAILKGSHHITGLIMRAEHVYTCYLLVPHCSQPLSPHPFHIIGCRITVCSGTHGCVTCQRNSAKPYPQIMGGLPAERITPGTVFDTVGVDFAEPILTKLWRMRKPVMVKSYICVYVSLTVKAVHLETVSDLTTDAFIETFYCLKRKTISHHERPWH